MRTLVLAGCLLTLAAVAHADVQCCGDCNGDLSVAVNELVTEVGYALNACPAGGPCCGDCDGSGSVGVNELVASVGNALEGCPGYRFTATSTPVPADTDTPTMVVTATRTLTPSRTVKPSKTPIPSHTPVPTQTETPTPTPTVATSCPRDFRSNNLATGEPICVYHGLATSAYCASAVVAATWTSNGGYISARLYGDNYGGLSFYGPVTDATFAIVNFAQRALTDDHSAYGFLSLTDPTHFTLGVDTAFICGAVDFHGSFFTLNVSQ